MISSAVGNNSAVITNVLISNNASSPAVENNNNTPSDLIANDQKQQHSVKLVNSNSKNYAGNSIIKKIKLSTSKAETVTTNSLQQHQHHHHHHDRKSASKEPAAKNDEKRTSATTTAAPMAFTSSSSKHFNIHEKLRELYIYLYLKDMQDSECTDNRIKLRTRSFVLETLVVKENLNTVILNLYPGNKGYSLAFRQEYPPPNKTNENQSDIIGNHSSNKNRNAEKEEHLLETVRWPYEMCDLLESINNEELPVLYMKLFVMYAPNAFYSGCLIMEVRDYRQSFPLSACCDNYYVLLKPTTQTLLADAKFLSLSGNFSNDDRVQLESSMVLATSEPLCLDPSPKVARKALYSQYKRQMWNSFAIRRQMRKFTQTAINRKRKLDQFTISYGLELNDWLVRARQLQAIREQQEKLETERLKREQLLQPQEEEKAVSETMQSDKKKKEKKLPPLPIEVIKPIPIPKLDLPTTLEAPSNVNVADNAKAYERTRETKDCMPQLIEEYILETDRGGGRVYHIKLSIYQRPANSEYLGQLYVDRDYEKGSRNGEACQFALGTRAHANRYIQQFTEIFTEEGRKSVKITHIVPGQSPMVSCTTGLTEHCLNQSPGMPIRTCISTATTTKTNQTVANSTTANIVTVAALASQPQLPLQHSRDDHGHDQYQQHHKAQPQTTSQSQTKQQPLTVANTISGTIIGITAASPQHSNSMQNKNLSGAIAPSEIPLQDIKAQPQRQAQLIPNGSLIVVQDPSKCGISGVATITSQQHQQVGNTVVVQQQQQKLQKQKLQQHHATPSSNVINQHENAGAPLPVLTKIQTNTSQTQFIAKSTTISSNVEMNSLMSSLLNAPSQQQQLQNNNLHIHKTSNNTAIISLLNNAPAIMTGTPIIRHQQLTSAAGSSMASTADDTQVHSHQVAILPTATILNAQQAAALHQNVTPNKSQQQQYTQLSQQQQVHKVQDAPSQQQQFTRVTMSALATQLSSPPAIMSNSGLNQTFTLKTVNQQPVLIASSGAQAAAATPNATNNRLLSQNSVRPEAMSSPGSDSNASSASSTNLSISAVGLAFNSYVATSPTASIISDGGIGATGGSQNTSALVDRLNSNGSNLSHESISGLMGQVPAPSRPSSSVQFMSPGTSSSNILVNQQQLQPNSIQVQSAVSISPITSPAPTLIQQSVSQMAQQSGHPTTATQIFQGINFSSLQGAMSSFPGLQNVQVQIPGLSQPISLALTGNACANPNQTTKVLVSVPVTSSNPMNQIQTSTIAVSNVMGQTQPTMVLTTAAQAQFVNASNMKTISQPQIRTGSNINYANNMTPTATLVNLSNIHHQTNIQQQNQKKAHIVTNVANAKSSLPRGNMSQIKVNNPINVSLNANSSQTSLVQAQQKVHVQIQNPLQYQHGQLKLNNTMAPVTMATIVSGSSGSTASGANPISSTQVSTAAVALDNLISSDTNTNDTSSLMKAVTFAVQKPKQLTVTEMKK